MKIGMSPRNADCETRGDVVGAGWLDRVETEDATEIERLLFRDAAVWEGAWQADERMDGSEESSEADRRGPVGR